MSDSNRSDTSTGVAKGLIRPLKAAKGFADLKSPAPFLSTDLEDMPDPRTEEFLKSLQELHQMKFESNTFNEIRHNLYSEVCLYGQYILPLTRELVRHIRSTTAAIENVPDLTALRLTAPFFLEDVAKYVAEADHLSHHHSYSSGNLSKLEARLSDWEGKLPDDPAVKAEAKGRKRDWLPHLCKAFVFSLAIPALAMEEWKKMKDVSHSAERKAHLHAESVIFCLSQCCDGFSKMVTQLGNALNGLGAELSNVVKATSLAERAEKAENNEAVAVFYDGVQKHARETLKQCDYFDGLQQGYEATMWTIDANHVTGDGHERTWREGLIEYISLYGKHKLVA